MNLFPIVGQDFNNSLLQRVIEHDRISHAYLFYGPEGSGHEGFALEFAAMLNCYSTSERPCGECPSCNKMKTLEHANLQLLFPIPLKSDQTPKSSPFKSFSQNEMEEIQNMIREKAKNPYLKISLTNAHNIPINFVREVKRKVYLKSQEKGWKVIVIFDAHLMTEQASNAFLKILEEPPPYTTFILTTSKLNKLMPTTISRCQPIYFPYLPQELLESVLSSKGIPDDHRNLIVRLSSGDLNQAISISELGLRELKETMLEIMRAVAVWNVEKIYDIVGLLSSLYKQNREKFFLLISCISFWFHDATVLKNGSPDAELIHSDLRTELSNFIQNFPDFDGFLLSSLVDNCIDFIQRNVYIYLALTDMLFGMHKAMKSRKPK